MATYSSKELNLPHTIIQNSYMARRASVDLGQGLDTVQIEKSLQTIKLGWVYIQICKSALMTRTVSQMVQNTDFDSNFLLMASALLTRGR